MNRSPLLVSAIVASALSTGVLLPFSCSADDRALLFGELGDSGDDAAPPGGGQEPNRCDDEGCADAGAEADDCAPLVERTCGACADSAACEAATLLARHERDRCTEALFDERRFPTCTERPCERLMERVCGGDPPTEACVTNPGCGPAQVLFERSRSSTSRDEIDQADASCAAALTDDAVFAPCGG